MASIKQVAIILLLLTAFGANDLSAKEQRLLTRTLVVGTKEAPPFAMKLDTGAWVGISIDLWRRIATELDLTFQFRELDLQGLLEGVANGSLDLAVAALTMTPERESSFDFTHPFHSTGLGIAIATKSRGHWLTALNKLFSVAFAKVIGGLTVLLLFVGLLVWWFERKRNPAQFGGSPISGLGAGFWWSAVTMTTVGYGDKAPITLGGRLVALIWMFASIIIASGFIAAIASSLTLSQLESLVQGPKDLYKVRVGTVAHSTSEAYLRDNRIPFKAYKTGREGLQAIREGRSEAFVYDAPLLRYLVKQEFSNDLEVLPNTFSRQDYSIALPAGSPLRELINRVLLRKIGESAWQDTLYHYLGQRN